MGRVVTRQGKGRASNSKTFHGLRHSFISGLANAGVSPEIRQKLAGHAALKCTGFTHTMKLRHSALLSQSCRRSRKQSESTSA